MSSPRPPGWQPAPVAVARLRRLHAEGMSGADLARRFGQHPGWVLAQLRTAPSSSQGVAP